MTEEELEKLLDEGKLTVLDYELTSEEVAVSFTIDPKTTNKNEKWETSANNAVSFGIIIKVNYLLFY